MKYLTKILVLSSVFVTGIVSATIAKDTTNVNIGSGPAIHQTLPALPKMSAPKTENIVFKPDAGIDPIITGPRS
ncbi:MULTISPECIES: hypothetical protein [Bartonella]|uniref:hypothetical protein n=1 Tax=Bartonella TaxID=773 RepID=UPI0018DC6279|nr:hypothetical protein [Bartonella choladocola]MBI0140579.1 hypothetical protein [Bartonella choladocola]